MAAGTCRPFQLRRRSPKVRGMGLGKNPVMRAQLRRIRMKSASPSSTSCSPPLYTSTSSIKSNPPGVDKRAWKRVCENTAVIFHMFIWLAMPILSVWLPLYILLRTRFWWTMLIYAAWFCYDFHTPRRGSRSWVWFQRLAMWRHFADYFPIKLVKTAELSPERNYIMGCHPHGIFSIAAFAHLCTDGTGFSKAFPGLEPSILTLNGQFWFPIRREIGLALGGVESSAESLYYLLRNPGRGRLVGIVIGGAEEIFDSVSGVYDLNIMSRRGFCRYALMTGAALVPSYSFGENETFTQLHLPRGSFMRRMQSLIRKWLGFAPPFYMGKSKWPILPHRHPITTVVGAPILVEKSKCVYPCKEEVDALHARYCDAITELFEKHKSEFGVLEKTRLNLL